MNKKSVTTLLALVLVLGTGTLFLQAQEHGSHDAGKADAKTQKVLVNLKHHTDDLHAAFMALKIAGGLVQRGADVTIFVNLEAVGIADRESPGDLRWGNSEATLAGLYDSFVDAGGKVMVCPHCAKAAGLTADSLRQGAAIADHGEAVDLFYDADKVVDY